MNIAYLISAHNDAAHLQRLINALQPDAVFFIHIDAKTDITPFFEKISKPNVYFIKERINVTWGNLSEVFYQRALLKACLESGLHVDRLLFLSGLDYPLWSNSEIDRFLLQCENKELIQGVNMCRQPEAIQKGYKEHRPWGHLPIKNIKWKKRVCALARKTLSGLGVRKPLSFFVGGKKYELHKGSAWWCITPELAQYMLNTLEQNPEFLSYFQTSFGPAETVWQTLVFNSPYAQRAMLVPGNYTTLAALTPLHYIYYHPVIKILDETDWTILQDSQKMFCRKVISGTSDTLMDIIDRKRLDSTNQTNGS